MKYTLAKDIIDDNDINALCDWLKSKQRLTIGPLTTEFEEAWANWLGVKHAVYVNSGSSANLLALYTLIEKGILKPGDPVVVPAVSWATDLAPVIQLGLTPILCDCNLDDLSIDLNEFEYLCQRVNPKALMFVSVLGLVPDMKRVTELCKKYNVCLIEDTCESLGSEFNGQKLGTFGYMSTFSLYFGHHISTIEGGIVATNDSELYDMLKSIRSHGWDRGLSNETQNKLRSEWNTNEFNTLYTFYYSGFNLRATDLQAFLGLRQLKKLDKVIEVRSNNFDKYTTSLSEQLWKPTTRESDLTSNFCYPIICDNRKELVTALKNNGVETRPLIAGSMSKQPFYRKLYGNVSLPNAGVVHNKGLYVPNHQSLSLKEVEEISAIINNCIS
jgi:CDP-6-deoxy-D-xylo-4-hexulose-3-dehydrase